jgi:supervillin
MYFINLRVSKRFDFGDCDVQIREIEEGDETDANFTNIFSPSFEKSSPKRMYHSLIDVDGSLKASYDFTPRLFLMTSLYGQFEAREILNPLRSKNISHFPFYQFQLYEEKQPAIFMLDNNNEIYIWQGWFESSLVDIKKENSILISEQDAVDGSTKIRYTMGRKCALQTAINYWKCKYKNEDKPFKGYVVYAGLEPIEFVNLFPLWKVNENARNCNLNVSD